MTLKIVGAGFGRTGTLSLKIALEHLGFDKCYHMQEAMKNPGHINMWYAASRGEPVDWDELLKGYQAVVDWPAAAFYKELAERYPDSKVLLSVRNPERWYDSVRNTIYQVNDLANSWLVRLVPPLRKMTEAIQTIIWEGTFHGKLEERDYAIKVFNQHTDEVKALVSPQRLLVYQVKQGWEPLCEFLGVPVPQDLPFPHANKGATMGKRIRQAIFVMRVAPLVLGGLLALILWLLLV